jgi:hypothetical protein
MQMRHLLANTEMSSVMSSGSYFCNANKHRVNCGTYNCIIVH